MDRRLLLRGLRALPNTGLSLKRFNRPTGCHGQRENTQVGAISFHNRVMSLSGSPAIFRG